MHIIGKIIEENIKFIIMIQFPVKFGNLKVLF